MREKIAQKDEGKKGWLKKHTKSVCGEDPWYLAAELPLAVGQKIPRWALDDEWFEEFGNLEENIGNWVEESEPSDSEIDNFADNEGR